MTSIDDKKTVDQIIANNGVDGAQTVTHIIEYQNQFNRGLTWKLCRSKEMYKYAMKTGSFIRPKLIWTQKETPYGNGQ